MKIIGITYYDGSENIVLKSDSSLLVNRKPLFVPERVTDLQALPCIVLRVSRLGKCIAPRFASRYYDAVAAGVDFFAADRLREAKAAGRPWTEAVAFENSLAVGEWETLDSVQADAGHEWQLIRGEQAAERFTCMLTGLQESLDHAVARASELLTIRQGDLIYVALNVQPWQLQTNDMIRAVAQDRETLYCKLK